MFNEQKFIELGLNDEHRAAQIDLLQFVNLPVGIIQDFYDFWNPNNDPTSAMDRRNPDLSMRLKAARVILTIKCNE